MPDSAAQPALLSQFLQEHPMGTTPTPKNILRDHPSKANNYFTRESSNYLWSKLGKTPEPRGTAQRNGGYAMHMGARWWIDGKFTTEQMHFVTEISKSNRRSIKVQFGPAPPI